MLTNCQDKISIFMKYFFTFSIFIQIHRYKDMNIGDKLKNLRKHYGFSQNDIAKKLEMSQHNVSYYESQNELSGLLEYIYKFCLMLNIPVADFFLEDIDELKKDLPDYITPADAAILKVLNTAVDAKTRIEVKSAFVHIMKAVLVKYQDKLGHMPEFKKLFGDEEKE